ncbi:unnamed protein product, partial [Trichogramma brassicae]
MCRPELHQKRYSQLSNEEPFSQLRRIRRRVASSSWKKKTLPARVGSYMYLTEFLAFYFLRARQEDAAKYACRSLFRARRDQTSFGASFNCASSYLECSRSRRSVITLIREDWKQRQQAASISRAVRVIFLRGRVITDTRTCVESMPGLRRGSCFNDTVDKVIYLGEYTQCRIAGHERPPRDTTAATATAALVGSGEGLAAVCSSKLRERVSLCARDAALYYIPRARGPPPPPLENKSAARASSLTTIACVRVKARAHARLMNFGGLTLSALLIIRVITFIQKNQQRVCLAKSQREIERTLAREKRLFSARGCNRFPRTRASNNNRVCVFWSEILRASLLDVYLPMRARSTAAGVISSIMQRNNKDDRAVTKTTPELLRIGVLTHIGYTQVGICFKKTAGWKPEVAKEDEGENEEEEEEEEEKEDVEGEEGAGVQCSVAARVNEGREKERNERWGPGYTHLPEMHVDCSSVYVRCSREKEEEREEREKDGERERRVCCPSASPRGAIKRNHSISISRKKYQSTFRKNNKLMVSIGNLLSFPMYRHSNRVVCSCGFAAITVRGKHPLPRVEICTNVESPFAPSINSIMHIGLIPCGYRSVWQLFSALIFFNVAHYGGEASARRLQRRKINVQPSSWAATAAARPCFVVVLAIGISRRAKSINHLLDIILEDCTIRIVRDPQRHSGRGSKRKTEKRWRRETGDSSVAQRSLYTYSWFYYIYEQDEKANNRIRISSYWSLSKQRHILINRRQQILHCHPQLRNIRPYPSYVYTRVMSLVHIISRRRTRCVCAVARAQHPEVRIRHGGDDSGGGSGAMCCKYTNHIVASYKPARSNHTNLRAHIHTQLYENWQRLTACARKTTRKIGSRAAICEATKK